MAGAPPHCRALPRRAAVVACKHAANLRMSNRPPWTCSRERRECVGDLRVTCDLTVGCVHLVGASPGRRSRSHGCYSMLGFQLVAPSCSCGWDKCISDLCDAGELTIDLVRRTGDSPGRHRRRCGCCCAPGDQPVPPVDARGRGECTAVSVGASPGPAVSEWG
jgi:hypothetical protein